jgi:hypothetical protein
MLSRRSHGKNLCRRVRSGGCRATGGWGIRSNAYREGRSAGSCHGQGWWSRVTGGKVQGIAAGAAPTQPTALPAADPAEFEALYGLPPTPSLVVGGRGCGRIDSKHRTCAAARRGTRTQGIQTPGPRGVKAAPEAGAAWLSAETVEALTARATAEWAATATAAAEGAL